MYPCTAIQMTSFSEIVPAEVFYMEIFGYLFVKDMVAIRETNKYFKSLADRLYENEIKKMAESFGIEDYKSDTKIKEEIRTFLIIYLSRKEKGLIFFPTIPLCTYTLFKIIHSSHSKLHLPYLTLAVLRRRDRIVIEDAWGIVEKILERPSDHSQSLKYLTENIYKIPRDDLIDRLREIGLAHHKYSNLCSYQESSKKNSLIASIISYFPKLTTAAALSTSLLIFPGNDQMKLVVVMLVHLLITIDIYLIWRERYESFADEPFL